MRDTPRLSMPDGESKKTEQPSMPGFRFAFYSVLELTLLWLIVARFLGDP